jgi:glycosyltransferase 2 family protein
MRHAATGLALVGVGLAMGAPFLLGAHAVFAGLRAVSWSVFWILAASAVVSAVAKAAKLQFLQAALGVRLRFIRTFAITLVTDFAFLVSPLGAAGYGVNMGLLQRAGASWAIATTVVAADQALDLTFFAVAVPISLLLALPSLAQITPKFSLPVAIGIVSSLLLAACIAWAARRRVLALLARARRRSPWLRSQAARWDRFRQSMQAQFALLMKGPRRRFAALLVLTTLQWLLRYSALWFILLELGHRLPLGFVLAVQAVVLHAALWTGVPAGGAGGDLGLAAAFAPWVPGSDMATALVLWRFATLYCPLALGAIGFAALAWRRHSRLASASAPD